MSLWSQLWLLLGKNITLRRRQPVTIIVEFIWPIVLLLIVAFIKRASPPVTSGPCYYQPLELPNGDFLSFTKSFVCMLDYKCYDKSRQDSNHYKFQLAPLYDIVTSGDNTYSKATLLLENLKNTLTDVNDLRHDTLVSKIQNNSITINDFLNDSTDLKRKLAQNGLNENIANVFLNSNIKIINIYKKLNISDKLRENNACKPLEAYSYLRANDYFYFMNSKNNNSSWSYSFQKDFTSLINQANLGKDILLNQQARIQMSQMTLDEQASYNLATILCQIPKRKLIGDFNFIMKEFNVSAITNYTNKITNYFMSPDFNRTMYYLSRYFVAGQKFGSDLALIQKFADFNEITNVMQNGLKLLSFTDKYNQQILFAKEMIKEFTPIFVGLKEFDEISTLIDFVLSVNKLFKTLDQSFTISSFYGDSLTSFFQKVLGSDTFISKKELLSSNINFKQTLQFLIKLKFGNIHEAFCTSPKLSGIFSNDSPDYVITNIVYQLDKYCQLEESNSYFDQLAEQIFLHLDYGEIVRNIKIGIPPEISGEFIGLANRISTYNFKIFSLGNPESLSKTFYSISASLLYLEESLNDVTKLNLKNVYNLSKNMAKIFLPTLFTQEQWTYLDLFVPMLLPVLDMQNNFETVKPTYPPYARLLGLNSNSSIDEFNLTDASRIDLDRNKRSVKTTTPSSNSFEEFYDFTTSSALVMSSSSAAAEANKIEENFYEPNNFYSNNTGFDISNFIMKSKSIDSNSAATATAMNPFSILNMISILNGVSGAGGISSATSVISSITPLLSLIPLDQYFPGISQQTSSVLINSVPQLIKLIETFTSFQLNKPNNATDNSEQIKQWKIFVMSIKSQAISFTSILSSAGIIKPSDMVTIQKILSTNFESITNPDIIGKVILGCEGINMWGIIQPNQKEIRNLMSSASILIDIGDLILNASLKLVDNDDGSSFECTNNPINDYYRLTKNLNIVSTISKLRQLIQNKQTMESLDTIPKMNCLKIDSVYSQLMKMQSALKNDASGTLKKKLNCFRTSIFMPYKNIIDNLRSLLDSAASNADTITLLSSQMNKFIDLVKLLTWINSLAEQSTSGINNSLLDDPKQLSHLLSILPTLLKDVNTMSYSLKGMEYVQNYIKNMDDISNLQNGKSMFKLLEALKAYEGEITHATQAIDIFLKKYESLINTSSYSVTLNDIQKGIGALGQLVNFFSQNLNGVKINNVFSNFDKISRYLQATYKISSYEADQIGDSRLYMNPQQLYDTYLESKNIYCDSVKLKKYLTYDLKSYIEVNDTYIENFWEKTSTFLCKTDFNMLSLLSENINNHFMLPPTVNDLLDNNSLTMQRLRKDGQIFASFNSTGFKFSNESAINQFSGMFSMFDSFSTNIAAKDLPNIFGKILCGPDFSLRLEDYGYTIKPATVNLDEPVYNTSTETSTETNGQKPQLKIISKKVSSKQYCLNLYNQMRTIGGPVIGNLITPLLYGKILYTPKNNVTLTLIQKFNETFKQFDQLNKLMESVSKGIDQLDDLKRLTANLSPFLDNPLLQDSFELFLLQNTNLTMNNLKNYLTILQNITSLSDDWPRVSKIVETVKLSFSCFETDRFIALDTEAELEKLAAKLFENATFLVGFVFENTKPTDTELNKNFAVKLRMNVNNVPETNLIRPWLWIPGPSDNLFMDLRYMRGFVQIQNLLERSIISVINERKSVTSSEAFILKEFPAVYLKQFPYPRYTREDMSASYVNYFILPIVVTLMWSGNIGLAIRNLIKEKEKFIEETMKAMGLRPGINWFAWFLSTYIAMLIVSVIVSCVLKYGHIFPLTNLGVIFLSLSAFAFSAIMLSFFVASFFSKTNLASLIGILAYFVSYLPFILVMSLKYELNFGSKFAMCLSTATAFGYSSLYISWYEQQGRGLQWADIWKSPIPNDTMNFGVTIMIMFLDGIIYGLLGWYVKKVFAGNYGASQPFYFIITPKFWRNTIFCRPFCGKNQSKDEYSDDNNYREKKKRNKNKDKYIEQEPDHLPVGISIKEMSRSFKERTVVNNLSLNFFEGQITALLGHNGAGKSTTINVLTGIYAPTNGTAYIYNRDVRYEYNQIRKHVGICPQHDILFDYMTVKEHLVFYGKLKENMGKKELKRDINDMMTKIGLTQYSNEYVSALSGGLRRRLEVAIAFVSGSKTVILDEPTSGVDPYNRMKIWDIILEFRAGRTILLTTHYLEEADVLSDRIAIIHQGKLQCCGSSLFLKNRFGSGYILTIDIKQFSNSNNKTSKQLLIEARCKSVEQITSFITKRINGATLTRQINNNYNFTLPYSQKANFEDFFIALEKNKNSLEIASYGISDTTLEEIFLLLTTRDENGELLTPLSSSKISDVVSTTNLPNLSTSFESDRDSGVAIELSSCESNKSSPTPRNYSSQSQILSPAAAALNTSIDSALSASPAAYSTLTRYTKLKGKKLYLQQFCALIMKRFHHYRRNLRILFTNIFLPCIFVALSMAFTTIRPKLTNQLALELTPEIYKNNEIFLTFDQTKNSYLKYISNDYIRAFNSVCSSHTDEMSPLLSGSSLLSSQSTMSSYLCDLVSADKCSLIYQFLYNSVPNRNLIFDSLKLYPSAPNCTIEPYLIETHMEYLNSRIGGLSYGDNLVKDEMYKNQSKVLVWFDNKAMHAAPSFLHEFYATYSKCTETNSVNCNLVSYDKTPKASETNKNNQLYKIYNHPISLSDERISYDSIVQKIADIGISLTILCAYSFIPAGFVVYIVREQITQEKRLQYVCGIKPFLYWFSSFIWDFVYYLIIIAITIGVIAAFGETAYTANAKNFGSLSLLLILFAWSSLPMSYVLSRFFKDVGSAYMMVFCFTLFSGIASCVAVFLLSFISENSSTIKMTYKFLEIFCLIFPSYSLGSGLIEITKNQLFADAYAVFGVNDVYKDPFSLEMLGQKYLSLTITGIVFFIMIAFMESKIKLFPCCKPRIKNQKDTSMEDIDVNQERTRIQNNEANSDILVVKNLTKKYRKATGNRVCAVNNVCFSIPWGHCFGLLGINGAGKTTTFKMITDEISPTLGSRLFNNMTMKEFLEDNIIGYCPQFDAVDELLTGNEALHIYSKLIGLTDINTAILTAITRFKLQSFIDVPIIKYSGGMKRTLSVAVAMLGNPQIVLLDEPTNGMDPEMRRRVWDNILKLIKEERSVLLTSHSMAECDALCSRLAIMVNGQFMCLGTTQHLKHRFGGGYTLQIKVSKDSAINLVIEFIEARFLNCILKDKHGNKLEYIIPHKGNSLGKIFGVMESNKFGYSIADYSVSQTTLDQVFINFAKSKRERGNSDEYEDEDEDEDDEDESVSEDENEINPKLEHDNNKNNNANNVNQIRVNLPNTPIDKNETSRFDSIKNHFNSLKKSKHIRKTSSAKSQHRRQSTRSRKSIRNSISNGDAGFTNLAYEIEFKNSDACDVFPMQESSVQDTTTNSFNEDGEFFSKC